MSISKYFLVFTLFVLPLFARQIDTFYGPIDVTEPVLLELIDCEAFQRLKSVNQYGVAYFTTHPEKFTRYDHSIGVFTILRARGGSIEEQIAGLLHDVSHTAFSHVGDWVFGKQHQENDYQNCTHQEFLQTRGISKILEKYGYTVSQVLPEAHMFPALECPLPSLCADRIDYNIQGACHQGFLTHEEAITLFRELKFEEPIWISENKELLKKLAKFSIYMTEDCWSSPANHLLSTWFAEALVRGIEINLISYEDIHFGVDQEIWNKLMNHQDAVIQEKMGMLFNVDTLFTLVDHSTADLTVKSKFRGVDPWVLVDGKPERLSAIDPEINEEFQELKAKLSKGWPIKLVETTSF